MDEPLHTDGAGRRRFLLMVGMAGAGVTLARSAAWAQAATPPAPPSPAAPAAPATPAAPAAPEISEDAKALAAIVERRYGAHLAPGDLKDITEEIEFRLQNGKRLRAARLANGDEPDFTFRA